MASVTLNRISKSFGDVEVLREIDLQIEDGEFCVFVGPSGCGKSTLLRMIAGLEEISSGDLLIGGERVNDKTPKARGIAMVFQSYALYPHRTVRGNMEYGLKLSKMSRAEINERVTRAANMLQIEPLLDRRPAQLSGGQRQRVAIGRAIVREPQVFLFDEPLSNLDAALRGDTRREIAQLHNKLSATMIYVTHDQVEAMTLADRIVVLSDGQVQQVGTPRELYESPANTFVAGFIGSPRMNLIPATFGTEVLSSAFGAIPVPNDVAVVLEGNSPITLGIRPENIVIADRSGTNATISLVEHLGNENLVELRLNDGRQIVAKLAGNRSFEIGETVGISIGSDIVHAFGAHGNRLASWSI